MIWLVSLEILSYHRLVATLESFSRFSSLQVNKDKTEIFAIGSHRLDQSNCAYKLRTSIKILGIVFDYNVSSRMKANFEAILKSIKNTINTWKWKRLTLLGRMQLVKSFIIPKVLRKVPLITVTGDLIKVVNSLRYRFIWKGNDEYRGWRA